MDFNSDIRFLKGVGEKRAGLLYKLGIDSVGALLTYYPRAYKNLSAATPIYETTLDTVATVRAKIISPIEEHYIRKNMTLFKFRVQDASGVMNVTVFNSKYLVARLHSGSEYLFYGKIGGGLYIREMSAPEIYETGFQGILPVYNLTAGITLAYMQKIVKTALQCVSVPEILPEEISQKYKLTTRANAINNIHFPKSVETIETARRYLIFEELLTMQCGMMLKSKKAVTGTASGIKTDYTADYLNSLPYKPTAAQMRCIKEALCDMAKSVPMHRLIEGDVGSGKTLVAAALCFNAVKNGYQAALMAPTVILAEQHYKTLLAELAPFGINITLLTGGLTKSQKEAALEDIESGKSNIVIGTHAVICDAVEFNNLALVITDEQHRFGVEQRNTLAKKGNSPHTCVLSATPIPRTLALTLYGELDISRLDEYPKGRKKIESYSISGEIRQRAYNYVKKHLTEGRQGYIVCPLVSEGESGRHSAEEVYKDLSSGFFKDYKLGLLHGKMKDSEKEKIMRAFACGEIDLLIATTVIEVGIDVPNAAIIVIEDADCFGLSALHQLRGRVGRGKWPSTCILISDTAGETEKRLKILCESSDGFKIAEEDLKLRGPGDFLGNRQHGLPEFKIADLLNDTELLHLSNAAAKEIISADENLAADENSQLKNAVLNMFLKLSKN